ncbi:type 1 fimbrial protein [Kluyvera sichuanensis]|uniref:Type 1 fimbrial protein n=1 Tax=Kluyvera sichuanensis TaxID=2725494 RepID=A0ABR6RQB1_9ENTR|nr:type 1 fimbrial protein [Kluyvera sichuanensis]MBC1185319.1 type 1 fimbrial protein [Kluyvera sichuanensis]
MSALHWLLAVLFLASFSSSANCRRDSNDSVSISTIALPDNIVINSRGYAIGTILYDSGFVSGSDNRVTIERCVQNYYVGFLYLSAPQTGSTLGGNVYPTNLDGIGVRVYTLNQAGPFDDARAVDNAWLVGDGALLTSSHTLNNSSYRLQLVATKLNIASGTLTLPSPLARVDFRESKSMSGDGDIASELVVSASQVAINAMGCTADVASLNFAMGDINMTQFDSNRRVGGVTQTMNLACEPGTEVTMTVQAAQLTEGGNADNTLIALSQDGSSSVASGIGVQLNLRLTSGKYDSKEEGLPLNTAIPLLTSSRVTNVEQGYTRFADASNPGGAAESELLTFTADYIKMQDAVTPGQANAVGVLSFIYN